MSDANISNPFEADRTTRTVGATQMATRENSEVMALAMMAKKFPRDNVVAADRIAKAFTRVKLAEEACYEYARGGSEITGPTIRAAEAMSQLWGNLSNGWREVSRSVGPDGVGVSEIEAFCVDYESTNRESIQWVVRHWRDTRNGGYKLSDERDIYELCANQAQRRKRACILAQIPGDVREMAMQQADVTIITHADTSPEGIAKLLLAFEDFGVSKAHIEAFIQRRIDTIKPRQFVRLRRIWASLRDGMSEASEWFKVEPPSASSSGIDAVKAAVAATKSAKSAKGKTAKVVDQVDKAAPPAKDATNADAKPEAKADTPAAAASSTSPAVDQAQARPDFDEAAYARKLQACTDVDVLDLAVDEIRDLPDPDMRKRLTEVYKAHRAAIS